MELLLSCMLMNGLQLEHHDSPFECQCYSAQIIHQQLHSAAMCKGTFHTQWLFPGLHDFCYISTVCIWIYTSDKLPASYG